LQSIKLGTTIFFWILHQSLLAQSPDKLIFELNNLSNDSLKQKVYYKLSYKQSRYDLSSCLSYADSAISIANRIKDSYHRDLYNYYVGVCHNRNGQYKEALDHFSTALQNFEIRKDTLRMADILYQMALVHRQKTEHVKFIEYINKSYDFAQAIDYKSKIGMCLNAKLIHYTERDKIEEAEKIGLEALLIFESIPDTSSMGDVLNNLGNLKTKVELYDEALVYHRRQHELNSLINNVWGLSYSHGKLGNLYLQKGQIALADQHLNAGLEISRTLKSPYELVGSLHKTAKLYLKKKQYKKAIALGQEALDIATEKELRNPQYEVLQFLSTVYEEQGDYKKSLSLYQEYDKVKSSTLNETISRDLSEIETKYETEKKEAKIKRLSLEDQLNEERISKQRFALIGTIVGLGLLSFLLFRIFGQKEQIEEQNQIISKSLKEKDTLLREIHHRVKNNLQVVSSLLRIQSSHTTDEVAIDALKEGQSRVQSMSLIHQDLYQKENLTGIRMQVYLERLIRNLFDTYNISPDRIKLNSDIEDINLDVDTVVPLGLVINELITNALKYAFPNQSNGTITLSLCETSNQLILEVADNGIGMENPDEVLNGDSFGYSLINAFANKLEGELNIKADNGSSIKMTIDNYQRI